MKLVDKLILLTRFLKDNKQYDLDIEETLQQHQSYWQDQQRFFKDKRKHERLDSILQQMRDLRVEYHTVLDDLNKHSSNMLREETVDILRRDYLKFDTTKPDLALMQERVEALDPEFIQKISRDIGYYSDWRWAGAELNPSNGVLTRQFLSCDPLYLYTDQVVDKELVKEKFNRFFAEKRMMFVDKIHHIPQGHLGLAVTVNLFEFWPMDPIKTHVKQAYDLLLPGGHFIFSYNDCEHVAALDLCANNYRSYNSKELMSRMVEMFGFEIVKTTEVCNGAHSWMVVKKPGELTSQKLTSPLVKIETPPTYAKGCAPGEYNYQPENHKK